MVRNCPNVDFKMVRRDYFNHLEHHWCWALSYDTDSAVSTDQQSGRVMQGSVLIIAPIKQKAVQLFFFFLKQRV